MPGQPSDDVRALQEMLDKLAESLLELLNQRSERLDEREKHRYRAVVRGILKRSQNLPTLLERGDKDWIGLTKQFIRATVRLIFEG